MDFSFLQICKLEIHGEGNEVMEEMRVCLFCQGTVHVF